MAAAKNSARKRAAAKRTKAPKPPATAPEPADPKAPKLTDEQRMYVVRRIAYYDTPSEIAAGVKEEFGVEITRQTVEYYDPEKTPGTHKRWKDLHHATREAFLTETAREPAAERAYRVRRLGRMAQKAETRGNFPLARDCYKQIAEEMGGKYTNKLELASDLDAIAKALGMDRATLAAALEVTS